MDVGSDRKLDLSPINSIAKVKKEAKSEEQNYFLKEKR
jgi:hypothetical protein